MGYAAYAQSAVLTGLLAYPYFAVVTHQNKPEDFVPCTNTSCTFVLFIGQDDYLPATLESNVNPSLNDKMDRAPWVFPLYVSVQNGHQILAEGPHLWFSNWFAFLYSWYPALFSKGYAWLTGTTHVDLPKCNHAEHCQQLLEDGKIYNHLQNGLSYWAYLIAILSYTILNIAHDWAVLSRWPERLTLRIGIVAWVCQTIACTASFLWGAGAMGVFIDSTHLDPRNYRHGEACYYRLRTLDMMLALVPPFLLWNNCMTKLENLKLAVAHGDFLYSVVYNVPFRVVDATMPQNPMSSLLTVGLHGDEQMEPAPNQKLSFRDLYNLSWGLGACSLAWISVQLAVIAPFTIGPLFRRLCEVAYTQEWSYRARGAIKIATVLAAVSPLFTGSHLLYKLVSVMRKYRIKVTSILFWLRVVPFFFAVAVLLSAFWSTFHTLPAMLKPHAHPEEMMLKKSWTWYFHGTLAFFLLFLEVTTIIHWPLVLRTWRTHFLCVSYRDLLPEEEELKTEWQLRGHLLEMESRARRGIMDERRREMMENSDSYESHVDHARESMGPMSDLESSTSSTSTVSFKSMGHNIAKTLM